MAAAVLAAALLHAGWHALVKSSGDQVIALAGMNLVSGAAALAVMPFVRPPNAVAASVIAASVCLHVGYKVALARLYGRADLSIAYPVARGITPVLATLLAWAAMGERPSPLAAGGVFAISLGILCLLRGAVAARSLPALAAALVAGSAVALYSVLDAYGVRVNGDWLGFTAWLVAIDSAVFVAYALGTRGAAAVLVWKQNWIRTLGSGLLGTVSFCVFLWALGRAQVGPVSSLRESSIAFAALIGMTFLGERRTVSRVLATILVMLGAGAIALAR